MKYHKVERKSSKRAHLTREGEEYEECVVPYDGEPVHHEEGMVRVVRHAVPDEADGTCTAIRAEAFAWCEHRGQAGYPCEGDTLAPTRECVGCDRFAGWTYRRLWCLEELGDAPLIRYDPDKPPLVCPVCHDKRYCQASEFITPEQVMQAHESGYDGLCHFG